MIGGWYYAHDENRNGPFSGEQLKDMAANGVVLPTDTVWKAGVDAGVLASRVKNLFAPSLAEAAYVGANAISPVEAVVSPPPRNLPSMADPSLVADESLTPRPAPGENQTNRPTTQQRPLKKGNATAIKGADMVGMDATHARYRMKCTECGHKDSSCRTIQLSNKMTKTGFFCPKCRKRREVVIQCRLG